MSNDIDGADQAEAPVKRDQRGPRGQIARVPIQITLTALLQDNGDGTWSATVPVLSLDVETGPGRDITLQRLADALSAAFTRGISPYSAAAMLGISEAELAERSTDLRWLAGVVIDATERELGKTIWPDDSNAVSELLDVCEAAINNALSS